MKKIEDFKIKIFADGADEQQINKLNEEKFIKGFTTNPSLMKKAGIQDYKNFADKILDKITDKPVSFEVFSDEIDEMEKQAIEIASWAKNVNVKIPITNTKGVSTIELIKKLSNQKIICNITAIFTVEQLEKVVNVLSPDTPAILSVFAGRIADTGIDPSEIMRECIKISKSKPKAEILWASTREILNIIHAENLGCHIITVPHNLLGKLSYLGKNLDEFSIETVKDFYKDAQSAGFKIKYSK